MKFKPGESGNPAGKPKGTKDKRSAVRDLLASKRAELVEKAVSLALAGDTAALKLCIDRLQAPIKACDTCVSFEMTGATLTEKAQGVITAIAEGVLSPERGTRVLDALAALARIREADELEERISLLERKAKP